MHIYIYNICVCMYIFIFIYIYVFLYMHRYVLSHGCWHCFFRINTWDEKKNISLSSFNHQRYWEATSRWIYPLSMASASLSLQVELNSPTTFCFLGSLYIYIYIYIYTYIYIHIFFQDGWSFVTSWLDTSIEWKLLKDLVCHATKFSTPDGWNRSSSIVVP